MFLFFFWISVTKKQVKKIGVISKRFDDKLNFLGRCKEEKNWEKEWQLFTGDHL